MNGWIIFGIITVSVISFFILIYRMIRSIRKFEISDWKVGDKLILKESPEKRYLEKKGREYAILLGVSLDEVVVSLNGTSSRAIRHNLIDNNKSAYWRRIEERCSSQMKGQTLGFDSEVKESSSKNNSNNLEKDLSLMNETELRVHLQNAIKEENYELAEQIKKELERFR